MKREVRTQRILTKSIKDHLISFVVDFGTSKAIYDKLVKLYSVSITGKEISLRNKIYKTRLSKYEYLTSYLLKVGQLRDQL